MQLSFKERTTEFYQALITKNQAYEGIFFVGVTSTKIFCRPSCAARKPKLAHCEFYATAQQALLAGFRPCKRCRPLSHDSAPLIQKLIEAIEENPSKRWKDADFRLIGLDASTARRQFKKRFGMTFVAYARARRMGLALQQIRAGNNILDTQLNIGYESGSGFRDAFSRILGSAPQSAKNLKLLSAKWLETPLGAMLAIGDEQVLYLLEFVDRRGLEREVERLRLKMHAAIVPGNTTPLDSISQELTEYFAGKIQTFKTPYCYLGSAFQQQVWQQLLQIPCGNTRTYKELAHAINKPTAIRAVGSANGANQLAIIIPCHRVISTDGTLCGYAGGLARKQWLLQHENKMKPQLG